MCFTITISSHHGWNSIDVIGWTVIIAIFIIARLIIAFIYSGQSVDPPKNNQTNDTPQPSVKGSSTMNDKESFHESHDGDDNDATINSNKNNEANISHVEIESSNQNALSETKIIYDNIESIKPLLDAGEFKKAKEALKVYSTKFPDDWDGELIKCIIAWKMNDQNTFNYIHDKINTVLSSDNTSEAVRIKTSGLWNEYSKHEKLENMRQLLDACKYEEVRELLSQYRTEFSNDWYAKLIEANISYNIDTDEVFGDIIDEIYAVIDNNEAEANLIQASPFWTEELENYYKVHTAFSASGSFSSPPSSEYLMIGTFIAVLLIGIAFMYRNSIKNIFNKHINTKTTQEIQISK